MFVGTINKGISIEGYIANNLLEPSTLTDRHDVLVLEMIVRGMKHKSPLQPLVLSNIPPKYINYKIDIAQSTQDLISRCPKCSQLHRDYLIVSNIHRNKDSSKTNPSLLGPGV
jgi:hypothetical protein